MPQIVIYVKGRDNAQKVLDVMLKELKNFEVCKTYYPEI